jgi:hypothetical protein
MSQYVEVSDLDKIVRGLVDRIHALETRESRPLVWTVVTAFANGWGNYGSGFAEAAYAKDASGRVFLRGLIQGGTLGTGAFTLPVGYRYKPLPPSFQYIHMPTIANNVLGGVLVLPSGEVVPYLGSNAWMDLSPVHFPAA